MPAQSRLHRSNHSPLAAQFVPVPAAAPRRQQAAASEEIAEEIAEFATVFEHSGALCRRSNHVLLERTLTAVLQNAQQGHQLPVHDLRPGYYLLPYQRNVAYYLPAENRGKGWLSRQNSARPCKKAQVTLLALKLGGPLRDLKLTVNKWVMHAYPGLAIIDVRSTESNSDTASNSSAAGAQADRGATHSPLPPPLSPPHTPPHPTMMPMFVMEEPQQTVVPAVPAYHTAPQPSFPSFSPPPARVVVPLAPFELKLEEASVTVAQWEQYTDASYCPQLELEAPMAPQDFICPTYSTQDCGLFARFGFHADPAATVCAY